MSNREKISSEFLREVTKTTVMDRYLPILKKHGWARKLEILKEKKGTISRKDFSTEVLRSTGIVLGITPLTKHDEEVLNELSTWAFSYAHYLFTEGAYASLSGGRNSLVSRIAGFVEVLAKVLDVVLTDESVKQLCTWSTLLASKAIYHLGWSACNRPSYMLSPDLAEMLKFTKLDRLPVEGLRLPAPTVVLAPPEDIMIELFKEPGCIIAEEMTNSKTEEYGWFISLALEGSYDHFTQPVGTFRMDKAGVTLEDSVSEAHSNAQRDYLKAASLPCPSNRSRFIEPNDVGFFKKALSFVCSCMVYATMPDADVILAKDSPEYASWIKTLGTKKHTKRERKEHDGMRQVAEGRRYYMGRTIKILDRHKESSSEREGQKGTHASPRLHWRSGHYRRVWHGREGSKYSQVHWIKPTLVGVPGTGPLENRTGMR